MTNETKSMVKARAIVIRDALTDRKLPPDQMTAAALLYLTLSLLKLDADELIGSLPEAIRNALSTLAHTESKPDDPDGAITLTQAELATLMASKIGRA